jgi:ubiquinone/menaquinone biosynthesis C-methylase UbiE
MVLAKSGCKVVACDPSKAALYLHNERSLKDQTIKDKVEFQPVSFKDLYLEANSLDGGMCNVAFSFGKKADVPDLIKKLYDALKPGAKMYIDIFSDTFPWSKIHPDNAYLSKEEIISLFEQDAMFTVKISEQRGGRFTDIEEGVECLVYQVGIIKK